MKMVPVHLSDKEAQFLDIIQGGTDWNKELGVRQYPGLAKKFNSPELRSMAKSLAADLTNDGKLDPQHQQLVSLAEKAAKDLPERSPYPQASAMENLARLGRGNDTKMALMPESAVKFLNQYTGPLNINPKTGDKEYFFPLILGFLGGLAGSAVASAAGLGALATAGAVGLGAMGGTKLGGGSWKQALLSGAGGAALSGVGSWMGGAAGGAASSGAASGAGTAAGTAAGEAAAAAPSFGSKLLSSVKGMGETLTSPGVTLPASLALMSKAHMDEKKNVKEYEENIRKQLESQKRSEVRIPRYRVEEQGEADAPLGMEDILAGHERRHHNPYGYKGYAAGGAVRGSSKGQADNINKNLPVGGYVVDASSTSDVGDGNTDAGFNLLDSLNEVRDYRRGGRTIPAKVSAGEVYMHPETVTRVGNGNNERGAQMFDTMVRNIRKHKRSNPHGLPPKALHPLQYMNTRG